MADGYAAVCFVTGPDQPVYKPIVPMRIVLSEVTGLIYLDQPWLFGNDCTVLPFKDQFRTGSRVYGIPREDSDIDVCVLVDSTALNKLWGQSDSPDANPSGNPQQSLRFKQFNLICMLWPQEVWKFNAWREGTQNLIARKPVTREEAITELDNCEARYRKEFEAVRKFENDIQRLGNTLSGHLK